MDTRIGDCSDEDDESIKSPLYLSKTYRDFYKDFDNAAAAEGILGENRKKLEERIKNALRSNFQDKEEIAQIILPVYVRLRAIGYNPFDLEFGM